MKIHITIDVDSVGSGYKSDDDIKDNIVEFTRDLVINGADEQEVELTLCEVGYE